MAFLSTDNLKQLFTKVSCIDPYNPDRVKNACYELSVGDQVSVSDSKTGKVEYLTSQNKTIDINPGQFALLLTEEEVHIPDDIIGFISIKAGVKFKGLVNVSGFHVDPGFKGKLLFSVYNAGPTVITLAKGSPCFLMWFSELTSKEAEKYNGHLKDLKDISAERIERLKGEVASPNVLLEKIKRAEDKLERVFWAFGILIALCVGILAKVWTDNSKVKDAYEAGLKERSATEEVKRAIHQSHLDCVISHKVNRILELKLKQDSAKRGE